MASPYLTPEQLQELLKGKTTAQVKNEVAVPPCGWGKVNPYPVAPENKWMFTWKAGLMLGQSSELDIMLSIRRLFEADLSEMLLVYVMASPLPATKKRSIPDWLEKDREVTKERYDEHPWWHPPGMSWEEVLELVKARREKERRIKRETLEHE